MDPVAQKVINFVMGGANDKEKKARLAMIEEFKDTFNAAQGVTSQPNMEQRQEQSAFQFGNRAKADELDLARKAGYDRGNLDFSKEYAEQILLPTQKAQTEMQGDYVRGVMKPGYDLRNKQVDSRELMLDKMLEADSMNRKRQNTMDMLRTGGALLLNFL